MTGCQTHVKCLGDSVCDSRVFWPHTSRQSILYIVSSLYHLLKQSHRQGQRCEQDTDGFHWVWLQFQRAKVAVCIRCSCVQSTGKKALYQVLNTHVSAPKDKKAVSLKVVGPLYSCLFMAHLPSGSRTLNWHLKTIYSMFYSILLLPLWSTHLLLCLEGEDAGDWSKDLLLHQSAVIRHICDHCWTHKITLHG